MPIITKPASIQKNVSASISLDKSQLSLVASVSSDAYFSNSSNWKEVRIHYKSSTGNQKEILKFDCSVASPSADFLVSDKARNSFEIEKIVIYDFDNGSFKVSRSELTVAEFDISFSGGGIPSGNDVVWDFASRPAYSLTPQNQIMSTLYALTNDTSDILYSTTSFTVPANGLEIVMTADNGWGIDNAEFFGVCDLTKSSYSGFYFASNIGIPACGIANYLQTQYAYPMSAQVEFKIVVKLSETLFYVNNSLIASFGAIQNQVYLATRFNFDKNIKSCTITYL